jgi:hypothetical protein
VLSDSSKLVRQLGPFGSFGYLRFCLTPLVKPDATPEEVAAVVQGDEGAGGQVFSQAVRVIPS